MPAMSSASSSAVAVRRFPLTSKQVMSILGIAPLGVYVVCHLWTNMYSLNGASGIDGAMGYDDAVRASRANPAMLFLELFGLGVPILIHALIGLKIIARARPNNMRYMTFRNLKYALQRLTGIGVLLFLGAHVIKARIMPAMEGHSETWAGMHAALSEVPTLTVYVLGMLGISYHLANGVWSSAITLGVVTTPRAMRRMEWVSVFVLLALLTMSFLAIWGFQPKL